MRIIIDIPGNQVSGDCFIYELSVWLGSLLDSFKITVDENRQLGELNDVRAEGLE